MNFVLGCKGHKYLGGNFSKWSPWSALLLCCKLMQNDNMINCVSGTLMRHITHLPLCKENIEFSKYAIKCNKFKDISGKKKILDFTQCLNKLLQKHSLMTVLP